MNPKPIPHPKPIPSFIKRQGQTLLTGLLAGLPLVLTIGVVVWVGNLLNNLAGPTSTLGRILALLGLGGGDNLFLGYAIGLVIVVLLLFLLGRIIQSGMQERIFKAGENLVRRIPLVGAIYDVSDRFVGLFERKEEAEFRSMSPVWLSWGGKGGAMVLALMSTSEITELGPHRYYVVLVPTAPVPFGGGLFFVPVAWVEPAQMGIEALTSIYVSMGVTAPEYMRKAASAEALEAAAAAAESEALQHSGDRALPLPVPSAPVANDRS